VINFITKFCDKFGRLKNVTYLYIPNLNIMILILIGTHIAAFVIGALVFRNNSASINKDISAVQQTGTDIKKI
jgi:hypothetical protein